MDASGQRSSRVRNRRDSTEREEQVQVLARNGNLCYAFLFADRSGAAPAAGNKEIQLRLGVPPKPEEGQEGFYLSRP
jgi:hypothetical protein